MHEDLLARRADYPVVERSVYLINNSLGAMHRGTAERLAAYAGEWAEHGVRAWDVWFPAMRRIADLVGATIGAPPGTTLLRQSVADAVVAVASSFDFGGRRNQVITTAADWPGTHYFWTAHLGRTGGELVVVPCEPDGLTIDEQRICDAIDDRTAVVSVSLVQFRTSALLDLAPVVETAHRHGAVVLLDAYQAVGAVPIDVVASDVDFCVGGSVKFLCGGPGNGWLYARPDVAGSARPSAVGWISHAEPFAFEWDPIRYADGVMRFAGGTPNVPAAYAAEPGYQAVVDVGVHRIRERSIALTQPLLEDAVDHGFTVRSPAEPDRRGGHVTVDPGDSLRVYEELLARGYVVDHRPGSGIRISPHFYNSADECGQVVAEMAAIRAGH